MPELPEVETICRTLTQAIVGHRIEQVSVRRASVLRYDLVHASTFEERLAGQHIEGIHRHGKYIVVELSDGWLLCHLGMTGKLLVRSVETAPTKHDHVVFEFDHGTKMLFNDVRRFGGLGFCRENPMEMSPICQLGPEPLTDDFSAAYLKRALRNRNTPIKSMLLDQHIVAGIGNIYADEILFDAGIRPRKAASRVTLKECELIVQASRRILTEAIEAGGSTIRDYVDSHSRKGSYQLAHKVYGREGEACVVCGTSLKSVRIGGRSSVYCSQCQKS